MIGFLSWILADDIRKFLGLIEAQKRLETPGGTRVPARSPNGILVMRAGQPAALRMWSAIVFSVWGVKAVRAKEVTHMSPSSSWAASSKPRVA